MREKLNFHIKTVIRYWRQKYYNWMSSYPRYRICHDRIITNALEVQVKRTPFSDWNNDDSNFHHKIEEARQWILDDVAGKHKPKPRPSGVIEVFDPRASNGTK